MAEIILSKDDAYKSLSAAIICQAILDWQEYDKSEKKAKATNNIRNATKAAKGKAEVEKFFKSQWCETLLGFSGKTILSRINKITVPYEVFGL